MEITFEQLPAAVGQLFSKLDDIERLLSAKQPEIKEPEQWLDLPALCDYLPDHPARQTVYEWVQAKKIPHYKGSKKLRFLKSEIDAWLMSGRRRTNNQLQAEAASYLK